MPDVDVSIVTWNSARVIRGALESLQAQTLQPASITIVDNASTDETRKICEHFPHITFIVEKENVGFAAAHNRGIEKGHAEFVLVLNPDVVLDAHYLERIVEFASAFPQAGACVGVVRRPDGIIDTTGLQVQQSRIVRERQDVPVVPQRIFGVSGAVALYRRQALHDVAVGGQYFDEHFFAYKEDVQLAWRLQWAGWQAYCVPAAHATHGRAVGKQSPRAQRDAERRYLSYRNHLLLYATVETPGTLVADFWLVLPTELARVAFLLITDFRVTVRALAAARKMWHAARTFAAQQRRSLPAQRVRSELLA